MTDPAFGLHLRTPPANLEAEQRLLGTLMSNNRAYERVADFLRADHFADAAHGAIYAAIARRIDAGQVADVVTLRPEFENSGLLDDAGGVGYLAELLSTMMHIINVESYGRAIRDAWLRREMIAAGEVAVNLAFGAEPDIDADQVLERVEGALFALGEEATGHGQGGLVTADAAAKELLEAHDRASRTSGGIVGLATGYGAFDRLKGGLMPNELTYLAGRPGMGKTALAVGFAVGAAKDGKRVYYASAEMGAVAVQSRPVAARSGLPTESILRAWIIDPGTNQGRRFTQREYDRMFAANAAIGALPIVWDVRAAPTVASIRVRARREKARHGLDLIVVDHIGLLSPNAAARSGNRNEELSKISAELKALTVELGVPVVVLSQLSRRVEERDDKRPMLSDLRDSGSLEQDADVVAFVYREEYYLRKHSPKRRDNESEEKFAARVDAWRERLIDVEGTGELIIAKHRQGREGTVRLRWDGRLTWFFDEDASAPPHAGQGAPPPEPHGASTGDPA